MLMQIPMIVLTSHLVVAVADHPPTFDIARGSKIDSASAFDPNAGMNATIKRCMDDEQRAKDQLDTQWSGFVNSDKSYVLARRSVKKLTPTRPRPAMSSC
jgi:hypothetical protein